MHIRFEKASLSHLQIIFDWLDEPHVQEFWDNRPEHKDDILNFINGRERSPTYYSGIPITYCVGLLDNEPYAFIMTNERTQETESAEDPWTFRPYLSKNGKTVGIDFCIGNPNFLGKGLAAPTLIAFTEYFSKKIAPETDTFLIDPLVENARAVHVFQKAGFQIKGEFIGPFDADKSYVMVKTL